MADRADLAATPAIRDGPDGGAEPRAEFRVDHPQERLALLRRLHASGVPVNLNAPHGGACSATLWSVDERAITFDGDAGGRALDALLDADEALAVAYLDDVKLQFDLHGMVLVHGAHGNVLRASMPHEVYRFQRRQSFRVPTAERLTPMAQLRHPAIPEMNLALRVLDVSLGGCALWLPADVPPLPVGAMLAEVAVTLDAATRFRAALRLVHVRSLGADGQGVRLGCEWELTGGAEHALQRFMDQAQKRRRLLAGR